MSKYFNPGKSNHLRNQNKYPMAIEYLSFKVPYTLNKITYLITFNHNQEEMAVAPDGSLIDLRDHPVWFSMGMRKGIFFEEYGAVITRGHDIYFLTLTDKEYPPEKKRLSDHMLFENLLNTSPSVSFDELKKRLIKELK